MTILGAMQAASVRLVSRRPSTFFGSSQKFELELCDLINEVAADIAAYQDWQALVRVATITGDGALTDYPLPADYDRMMLVSDVMNSTNWLWGYFGFVDINEFLLSEAAGFQPWPGGWIIYNNRFRFSPAPMNASEARFPYISKNWAQGTSATKAAFDNDTDTFLLPERLLTLGLVWRWRENKGLSGSDGDRMAFEKAMDQYGTKDTGSKVIRFGGARRLANTSLPYMGVGW